MDYRGMEMFLFHSLNTLNGKTLSFWMWIYLSGKLLRFGICLECFLLSLLQIWRNLIIFQHILHLFSNILKPFLFLNCFSSLMKKTMKIYDVYKWMIIWHSSDVKPNFPVVLYKHNRFPLEINEPNKNSLKCNGRS